MLPALSLRKGVLIIGVRSIGWRQAQLIVLKRLFVSTINIIHAKSNQIISNVIYNYGSKGSTLSFPFQKSVKLIFKTKKCKKILCFVVIHITNVLYLEWVNNIYNAA